MKNVTRISRRSFLKAAMAASAVSALAFTGCGGSASSTVAASSTASSAAAEGGQTFKVGIVNYVDHASLNQIVESVESRLDELPSTITGSRWKRSKAAACMWKRLRAI